jgi:hypothetical protein
MSFIVESTVSTGVNEAKVAGGGSLPPPKYGGEHTNANSTEYALAA